LALQPFEAFADEVLFKIAEKLDLKISGADIAEPANPRNLRPFLWFPEADAESASGMGNDVA
jgi:hypothetical protein